MTGRTEQEARYEAVVAELDKLRAKYKVRFDQYHDARRRAESAEADLAGLRSVVAAVEAARQEIKRLQQSDEHEVCWREQSDPEKPYWSGRDDAGQEALAVLDAALAAAVTPTPEATTKRPDVDVPCGKCGHTAGMHAHNNGWEADVVRGEWFPFGRVPVADPGEKP